MTDELLGNEASPQEASTEQVAESTEATAEPSAAEETTAEASAEAGESAAETAEETTEATKQPKMVPLAALHEERERRKELSAKLDTVQTQSAAEMARLQERVNIILQTLQQATEPPKDDGSPLFIKQFMAANPGVSKEQAEEAFLQEEPNNYLKWRQDELAKQTEALKEFAGQQVQGQKQQEQFQQFVTAYQSAAQEFKTTQPDFQEAYTYLLTNRDAELQAMGFTDPVQRKQIMHNEEIGIVDQAFRNRTNPAQRLYEIAKFRGYTPAKSVTESAKPAATLTQEKKAATATKSLGAVPGTATGKLTAETLASMTDEEFAKATSGDNWKKFFQGGA